MPDLSEWTVLLLDREARLVDGASARVPLLARMPESRLARAFEWTGVGLLLALGVLIGSAIVWALLAIPMTVCVLAFLLGLERSSRAPSPAPRGRRSARSRRVAGGIRPRGI